MSDEIILDDKYIILNNNNNGKGLTSEVFKVEDIKTKKIYVAKILSKHTRLFDNEREFLNLFKNKGIENIVNIIDSGDGNVRLRETFLKKQYIILDYAEKGDLSKYITLCSKGFSELHAKLLFSKILNAVKEIHKNGVCHRDLKTANILLDNKFNPKICDFGFATYIRDNLNDCLGTFEYAAPEIYKRNYNGVKVDIFALGVILFNLVTGIYGFEKAEINDKTYKLIMIRKYDNFWQKMKIKNLNEISDGFKKLFVRMVALLPKERPPTIDSILEDDWMKEIKEKNENELKDLELELYEEFLKREEIIKKLTQKDYNIENQDKNDDGNRSLEDGGKSFFNIEDNPIKEFKKGKIFEYFIKIKGNLSPFKYMNDLANKIEEENEDEKREYDCKIEPIENKLKFKATFNAIEQQEEEENDEEIIKELEKIRLELGENNDDNNDNDNNDDNDDNNDIERKECIINVELFKYENEGFLLRFLRKSGEMNDFYKIIKKLYSYAEKKL